MGRPLIDITGQRFGLLKVVARFPVDYDRSHSSMWTVDCDCGKREVVSGANLRSGKTKSCGCKKTMRGPRNPAFKHGMTASPEHSAYRSARSRCNNPKTNGFERYGGRGIRFLFSSFAEWFKELGPRPTPQHSVDRINNEGHYTPGNVRWATKREQVLNRPIQEYGVFCEC